MTAAKTTTVRLGQGIVTVLQLNARGICEDIGVEIERYTKRHAYVSGTKHALQRLAERCDEYGDPYGWDVPPWYHRSARIAAKRIRDHIAQNCNPPDDSGDDMPVTEKTRVTTYNLLDRTPDRLDIPIRAINGAGEGIALGLRQEMLSMGDVGAVLTGTGLGSDAIILKWGDRQALVRGSELLRAWVSTFAPEDADRFPEGISK